MSSIGRRSSMANSKVPVSQTITSETACSICSAIIRRSPSASMEPEETRIWPERAALALLVLRADGAFEDAAVDHPRGDQQVAELGGARRLGGDQPAAVEADHRALVAAEEQQRARPPPEVNELHHVGDGDVFQAAGDSHGRSLRFERPAPVLGDPHSPRASLTRLSSVRSLRSLVANSRAANIADAAWAERRSSRSRSSARRIGL